MEYKSLGLQLKDMDLAKRTAIIAHAAYDDIDRTRDISRRGMFTKSWQESKEEINFYLNHNDELSPGKVEDVFEDEQKAYTKVWLGTHTLGEDTLKMMDEGIIKKASFGYIAVRSNPLPNKIRELKEVKHLETSVLTKIPAHGRTGVVKVVKSLEPLELKELMEHLATMEKFCRDTTASDMCIKSILIEIEKAKNILSQYDTESTRLIDAPDSSRNDNELAEVITRFTNKLKIV